eukprot:CAMPEP_0183343098 /NCGR_PEP_ID=MMETSP0164_2-20130417/9074_1 /TAXON_ID=221442 /ORGANISM="Coccolithus pelagicus ssp braarudi, Strain PLY182g" /LENGTH=85 /DNA_ID=CAMNT_0025513849 /DNA_START=137 /DNA_END=395 /DNA_ORIENTATION=-
MRLHPEGPLELGGRSRRIPLEFSKFAASKKREFIVNLLGTGTAITVVAVFAVAAIAGDLDSGVVFDVLRVQSIMLVAMAILSLAA